MSMKQSKARLHASMRFFGAYHKLPHNAQGPVWDCVSKLMQNPAHPSLNYEAIRTAGDARLRSVRVNEQYRLIVAHPDGSGAYVLLWVDKHDDAYMWAARHRLETGDEAAGLALVEYPEREAQPAQPQALAQAVPAPEPPEQGNLRLYSDEQLVQAGVPEQLVPALRACHTDADVQRLLDDLSPAIANLVLDLWTGTPQAVPVSEPAEPPSEPGDASVAVSDTLEMALSRPGSARHFVAIATEEDLRQALKYPLELWRVFLHPEQRKIVRANLDGPALVSGGAGTGKTVVGLHRARYLASEVFTEPGDRVLLTTFTANLADNLSTLMNSLCGDDLTVRKRIEVTHVHSLAAAVRHQAREHFDILSEDQAHQLMRSAAQRCDTLGLSVSFYLAEWQEVAQEREALTEEAYLQIDREGRGRGFSRRQRAAIWKVLEAYSQAVDAARREEWSTVVRRARHLIETHRVVLPKHYRAVIVDEAQDMGTPEMRFLLALVGQRPNSLLLLGDTRQQIYARGSYVRLLNIPIGRRHMKLRLNYRTTEQIRSAASTVVTAAHALTGESLGADDSISLLRGPIPLVQSFATQAEEDDAIVAALRDTLASGMLPEEIVVVARTGALLAHYGNLLLAEGIPTSKIDGKSPRGAGVQLATMHRAKGLEFRATFIVGCSADTLPQPYTGDDDDFIARGEHVERERRLLYVAMTRAREILWISGSGRLSPLLPARAVARRAGD